MKKALYIALFACMIPILFVFKPRQDLILGAINDTQSIRLFEKGKEFELRVGDNQLYTGTYSISKDTVFLQYQEHMEFSNIHLNADQIMEHQNLPERFHFSENDSQIKSALDPFFSAAIYSNKAQTSDVAEPVYIRSYYSHPDLLTALGTNGPSVLLQR